METGDKELDPEAPRIKRYKEEIAYYEKEAGAWHDKVRKILRRYKDERSPREQKLPRFNMLYSNIATLMPAVYGRNPKPDIERRFKDNDPLGRVTSEVLERTCSYFIETEEFRSTMRNALFDRLIGGRGVVWARYVPHFKEIEPDETPEEENLGEEVTDDKEELDPVEEVSFEEAITDYVHWDDFGHNWSRTFDELYIGWRRVFLTREELISRFGKEIGSKIPLDYFPKGLNDQKKEVAQKKAVIYEIWDDEIKRVAWLHKDCEYLLDDKEDPLKLADFFPFPKPFYGILANDSLIPVPDYVEYQDQALELDELTSRIAAITKAIKVAGVYDASAQGVERVLAEGVENKLIPVTQWAIFGEKGGLKGVMDLLPMKDIMDTLLGLYEAREKVKADLYEITGIADIVRGNADPRETATASRTKSNFATIRLSDTQDEMARFARDAVKNICVIIATHFSIDTIKRICGLKLLTNQEKQQIQMQQQQAQQQYQQAMQIFQLHQQQPQMPQGVPGGQPGSLSPQAAPSVKPPPAPPPAPPPLPDSMIELLEAPTWEEVDALLKNEPALSFKIDIEIDSTIKMDEEADKAARVEFLESSAKFITAGIQAGTQEPALMPLFGQMLLFGVRGFKVGKDLEGAFNVAIEKMEKAAANPQPKQSPEMMKAQADIQSQQARAKADEADAQMDAKMKMMELQQDSDNKQRELQQQYDLKMREMQMEYAFKEKEMAIKNQADIRMHEASQRPPVSVNVDGLLKDTTDKIGALADGLVTAHTAHTDAMTKTLQTLQRHAQQQASRPKTVTMKRPDGSIVTAQVS